MLKYSLQSLFILTENESETSSSQKIVEALKNMIKNPVFYIVLGAFVFLIILVYFLRRIVKAKPDTKTIIVRKGRVYRIVDETNPTYFLAPFVGKIGADIYLGEKELNSDQLFVNNGPDHLYQINFSFRYMITDAVKFYDNLDGIDKKILMLINESLREFADNGHASKLIKEYRENSKVILDIVNKAIESYSVQGVSFKINFIQPLGGR